MAFLLLNIDRQVTLNQQKNSLARTRDAVAWRVGGRMPRRILEWKPVGRRIRGRPRKRWIEDIEEDI